MSTVTLLTHTQDPEKIVAAAAKLCYSASSVEELLEGLTPEKSRDFVDMLGIIGHESPVEHCTFTFAIQGVSRAFLAQMTRHRLASYSVQSQRYVSENSFDYVIPPEIEADPQAKALFEAAMQQAQASYTAIAEILRDKHSAAMVEKGLDEKTARQKAVKMAIEDARFVLPNACETKMVVTMNVRSLLNFFRLRCCRRAQWEIREVADKMLRLVVEKAPALFAAAGPGCVNGACPEGKMTCGKPDEVRAHYQALKGERA